MSYAYRNVNYHDYIRNSPNWQRLRRQVWSRGNGICERCHSEPIAATHHLTYARLGDELLCDLQGLCTWCHDFVHKRSTYDPCRAMADFDKQMQEFLRRKLP